jgi:hypothetical protein
VRQAAARRGRPAEVGLLGEAACGKAGSDLNGALQGSNVEVARVAKPTMKDDAASPADGALISRAQAVKAVLMR